MTDKFNENLKKARQGRPNGAQGRFSVPKYVPILVPIPIKKAPQNAKYSVLRGILSAGSGGRTRTG